jgi:sec-independent protein translocase protein TatB
MFDIGFSELVLVGVVGLLAFGPERLPKVAREAGLWIRKGRSVVASVKAEIDRELQVEELRRSLGRERRLLHGQALDHLATDALAAFPPPEPESAGDAGTAPVAEPPPPEKRPA